jgi:hypothetical protein
MIAPEAKMNGLVKSLIFRFVVFFAGELAVLASKYPNRGYIASILT